MQSSACSLKILGVCDLIYFANCLSKHRLSFMIKKKYTYFLLIGESTEGRINIERKRLRDTD